MPVWRQGNLLLLPDQQAVLNIQTESPPFDSLRGSVGDDTAETMHKLARCERVPEVPVDTRHLIQTHPLAEQQERGHPNRQIGKRVKEPPHVEADRGHIKEHQGRGFILNQLQGLTAYLRHSYVIALLKTRSETLFQGSVSDNKKHGRPIHVSLLG